MNNSVNKLLLISDKVLNKLFYKQICSHFYFIKKVLWIVFLDEYAKKKGYYRYQQNLRLLVY